MTTSIAALEHRAARLLDLVDSRRRPQTRVFVLEAGDELTTEQRGPVMGPRDRVIIREYPKGYFKFV